MPSDVNSEIRGSSSGAHAAVAGYVDDAAIVGLRCRLRIFDEYLCGKRRRARLDRLKRLRSGAALAGRTHAANQSRPGTTGVISCPCNVCRHRPVPPPTASRRTWNSRRKRSRARPPTAWRFSPTSAHCSCGLYLMKDRLDVAVRAEYRTRRRAAPRDPHVHDGRPSHVARPRNRRHPHDPREDSRGDDRDRFHEADQSCRSTSSATASV